MTEEVPKEPLRAIVFAGPNGSGKSTLTTAVIENPALFKGEYINADVIAKSLEKDIPNYRERNLKAANIAEERRLTAFRERRPVAFETVLSTPEKVALMTHAKAEGYEVTLVFITTKDPDLNVQRVANRVEQGGHAVDSEAIRDRYGKTMNLLPAALDHADQAQMYDNSGRRPIVVAVKNEGEVALHNPSHHPAWVKDKLVDPYLERMESREQLQDAFEKSASRNSVLKDADASNGKQYAGKIVAVTKHHALQQTDENTFVVHDRSLTANKEIQKRKASIIEYAFYKGKILTLEMRAVKAFETEPSETALAKHPQLASAYAAMTLVEKQAQADGLDQKQREIVINAARANIAKSIETGKYSEIKIREEIEVKHDFPKER